MTNTQCANEATPRPPLPRSVVLLGWVSFFADVSSEMAYPLLPLFIVGVLAAPATVLGGVEGVAQVIVAVVTAVSGWRSDRSGRRVMFVRWGYGLPVVGKGLLAAATIWPVVLLARGIDRIGKGLRGSPRDAMIAQAAGAGQRGRAFGFHRAMDTAGAMVGVLLSALLLHVLGAWDDSGGATTAPWIFRIVFAVAAVLGLVSLVLTLVLRDEPPSDESVRKEAAVPDQLVASQKPPERFTARYWLALSLLMVFALANSSDTFLLLRAAEVGLSPMAVVLAYALYNLTYTVISYPAGILSDRFGRWKVIGIGWFIYALVYAGFALTGAAGVWPLMALYGCYMALTDGVGKALIADHAPPQRRGTAMGIMHLSLGLMALAGNLIAGLLWENAGPSATFWFGASAAAVALLMLMLLRSRLAVASSM